LNILLDTHVLVWSQEKPEALGAKTRKLLTDPSNSLFISSISALEIGRLLHLDRLLLNKGLLDWLKEAQVNLQSTEITLNHSIACESYSLPGSFHKDPADRILVATARLEQAKLLTADHLILGYPHVTSLDARK
jgi:PIN domain nuclease of toxin-antitoxin system